MRRWPLFAAAGLLAALAAPLLIAAAVASAGGAGLWAALHACARVGATLLSLPALLALALAASMLVLGLRHLLRQALLGVRALDLLGRHAVAPPPDARRAAERLGARLVVVDLPERLACCIGLLRPRVVVSLALVETLGRAPLEAVLTHEVSHARRRDPLRQVLAHAAAKALWFAPLAVALAAHQRLRNELAADRAAERRAGRRALAEALLSLHTTRPAAASPAIAGGATFLDHRIDALIDGAPTPELALPRGPLVASLAGVVLAALLLAVTVAAPAVGPDPLLAMPMDDAGLAQMAVAWVLRACVAAATWVAVRLLVGQTATVGGD
jgi:beta-lactamase regulating signal transducer with metallopeptidase domain